VQFEISLTNGINNAYINLNGAVFANLDLLLQLDYSYDYSDEATLLTLDVPVYGTGYTVAGIPLQFGFFFNINRTREISFQTSGNATVGWDADFTFDVTLAYGPNYPGGYVNTIGTASYHYHPLQYYATGTGLLSAGLKPLLKASMIGLVDMYFDVEAELQLTASFLLSGYPALAAGIYPINSTFHYGPCNYQHLIEYELRLVVFANLSYQFYVPFIDTSGGLQSLWSTDPPEVYSILSGCLVDFGQGIGPLNGTTTNQITNSTSTQGTTSGTTNQITNSTSTQGTTSGTTTTQGTLNVASELAEMAKQALLLVFLLMIINDYN